MNLANFRELGGYQSSNGKKVKNKRLLRSGEVYQLNEASVEALNDHELTKIIDLRGEKEISSRPDDKINDVSYHWIDIMKEVHDNGSMEDLMDMADIKAVDRHMMGIYENLILNEGAQEGYQKYFKELLSTETGGVLFHCFAGKDRTGIAAVLTLELLDVPKMTIYEDYLATNRQRKKPNELFLAEAASRGFSDVQLAGAKVALEVKKEYLDYSYDLINQHFGGVQNYTKEVLKVNSQDVQLLQHLYLEK
ncbi:tyrosine-protein phosphatase [Enterococcus rivorum]|uniref:Protein tyrosine phosphatase n=1 Tax=Enterococcus rivorum TaxID=762845 RepID=A0A1E5KX61_9ENTE|nr:tyrosine-protein phosphatase [Enterococcus rivorum]MBP2097192.1 protein-tyrosine phosphatase [Enterococcus rivorum]OEH82451.1 protein tyrosine phosphatase [Enterococcus rivorum]